MVPLLRLCDADIDGVDHLARRLARLRRLEPGLFQVADGVVVTDDFDAARDAFALQTLLEEFGPRLLAVRSCGLAGGDTTEFGVVHDHAIDAIRTVRTTTVAAGDRGSALIQPMLRSTTTGVLLTRSPANAGLASCEYAAGVGNAVVAGKVAPPTDAALLERLFLVGMTIEQHLGGPQEIEWTHDSRTGQLTVLQARDVTAHTCVPEVATEQQRVAETIVGTRGGRGGRPAFRSSISRDPVSSSDPMTRSLIERLHSPLGSLGEAFEILGLPHPKLPRPYVTSLFGKLYVDIAIESRLFGSRPLLWWSRRKFRRRVRVDRSDALVRLKARIDALPLPANTTPAETGDVTALADHALDVARRFVDEIYPVAYVATLTAQMAYGQSCGVSGNGRMLRDLSCLHCGGTTAAGPWHESGDGEIDFSELEELARDRAMRWFLPLRNALDALGRALGLAPGEIFLLDLDDVEAIASDRYDLGSVREAVERARSREACWAPIDLGPEPTLAAVERLRLASR